MERAIDDHPVQTYMDLARLGGISPKKIMDYLDGKIELSIPEKLAYYKSCEKLMKETGEPDDPTVITFLAKVRNYVSEMELWLKDHKEK